ncbi:unnamed protein product [Miscanthus lutarioriparius]|uniref:60S ribosomal protein L7a n=1 Tax=Miscanthus lutarioriparius TaxID=422564 RepID=A0A811S6D8_9POAL|nr:unnamed protein product [Miscanthus lutarioriparius]
MTFYLRLLTRRQRVGLAWLATCANVVNEELKLLSSGKVEKVTNQLFEKRPKKFGIGGALPPKKDLHRFVKWPKGLIANRGPMDVIATNLFKMLLKYPPEDKAAKERLLKRAQARAEGKTVEAKKQIVVKYGLNHVTYLIEQNKAQLVVIAHDVDPIELVVWLPALCRNGGSILHRQGKSTPWIGCSQEDRICSMPNHCKNEDKLEFSKVLEAIKANFNDKFDEVRKKWGGGVMGSKSQAKT